jgi:shikimate kinase/3-dehydroquinate synthase
MKSVVLSGFMATGKTTVGKLVAAELGLPFVDTDDLISAAAGKPVGDVFASEGEARFRDRELDMILPLLSDNVPRVLSFGGGAVTVPRIRHTALEAATVVTLTGSPEVIAERATSTKERPALGARSKLDRVKDMLALRAQAYGECHGAVSTDGRTPEEIARQVIEIATQDAIAVPLGTRSYAVELGHGSTAMLTQGLRRLEPSSVFVVTDENVLAARGAWLASALSGTDYTQVVLAPGEESKTLSTVSTIWDAALAAGVDRRSVVLAFGGGVVGDMAGFAASTLLRGVRCVQIATSLLAMVDSSVGGKTGFDHAAGKNLLGSFFQPSRVILDVEHLSTLPDRHRAAGLAEVVKIALVRDPPLLDLLEARGHPIALGDGVVLRDVIRAAVLAKMRVVREDEHETGVRALLNLGHTVGHALETHGGYKRWIHGEAIAIGTVLELQATERLGLTPLGTSERAAALFTRFGLPTTATPKDVAAAWPYVMSDKKRTKTQVKLPVVTGWGAGRVEPIELETLKGALGIGG